jgi:hypothetical protein
VQLATDHGTDDQRGQHAQLRASGKPPYLPRLLFPDTFVND